MLFLVITITLLAFASSKPCDTEESINELLLSLNKDLLRSLETQEGPPNPSVHLALRLSNYHNLAKESEHLNKIKTHLHNDIQNSLSNSHPVTGLLALYTLALKSSCYDLTTVHFTVNGIREMLLTQLKRQMDQEKEHVFTNSRPLTNYYQYSLGLLALCVSGVRVNHHVTKKLIKAVDNDHFTFGSESVDTFAMAGQALQCVKDDGSNVQDVTLLTNSLTKIKQKLLAAQLDGHNGNKFSRGLVVQALLAMGSQVAECAASMEAIRTDARMNIYHNPMALSQILPALQHKSYLAVKSMECVNEDNTLVLEPIDTVVAVSNVNKVIVEIEVVSSSGETNVYPINVPKGSSLLQALELLKENTGFTFETEHSLWGPYLSIVNGEQARLTDRRYWHLSSDGTGLSEGIRDFKIQASQKITIKNTSY